MAWPPIFAAIERSLYHSRRKPQPRLPLDPFFALSPDPFCITKLDGHLLRVNPAFAAALGYPEPDLLALNILDLLHVDDRPAAAAAIGGLARGFPIAGLESRFRCGNGACTPMGWKSTPFPAAGLAYTVAYDRTCPKLNAQAERLLERQRDSLVGRSLREGFPEAADGPSVYFRDAAYRHQADEKIQRALQEKEVLLREVHHRVKNNLQVICSMLRLQERNFRDDTLVRALRDCRERVHAMAMLHDQLHRAKDFSNINLGEYIRNLATGLFSSYGVNSADVELHLDVENIPVFVDTAIPCGLIVNELVSNSLQHAFPEGRKGRVSVGLHAPPGGGVEIAIADDGRGFSEDAQPTDTRSLGLLLVELLAGQICAAVERPAGAGVRYRIRFQETAGPASMPVHLQLKGEMK